MLDWLKPESDLSVWGDVVRQHFTANASAIQQRVGGWAIDYHTKTQLTSAMRNLQEGERGF